MSTTVVKANYVQAGDRQKIKASARYYAHRPDLDGERIYREGFSKDQDALSKDEIYQSLDNASAGHTYHYRMVLAPGADAAADGGDLKSWTRDVMAEVEVQHGGKLSWVAVEHAYETSHTDHAHVHVIASTNRTFGKGELAELREHGTQRWTAQMEELQELKHDTLTWEGSYDLKETRQEIEHKQSQGREL